MVMITPAEFEDTMKELVKKDDNDEILRLMCNVLIDNGYGAGVQAFVEARGGSIN